MLLLPAEDRANAESDFDVNVLLMFVVVVHIYCYGCRYFIRAMCFKEGGKGGEGGRKGKGGCRGEGERPVERYVQLFGIDEQL